MVKRFILLGHVDHGKSTLGGHLLHLTGNIDDHEVARTALEAEKLKMTRWKWAYLLDTCSEERTRGKTHEYSIIPFTWNNEPFELIDTPGHAHFVRSTISAIGLYPSATAVLVVSAIENEFDSGFNKGMTKEQCILARASGIQYLVVAVNKMDAVSWSKEAEQSIQEKMTPFLKKLQFTFVRFVSVSAYEGTNLLDILEHVKQESNIVTVATEYNGTEFHLRVKILECENIITPGYTCVVHCKGEEFQMTIVKIKDKKFVRSGDICFCIVQFSHPIELFSTSRLVLRNTDMTIGFATVVKGSGQRRVWM
jgi:translation elongation factor EF-1alpha